MINKKTLAVTALALLLSQQSFASEESGFYFGGGYHGQFFNSTSPLKVKIGTADATAANKVGINDRDAEKTKGQKLSDYKADYNPPFAANFAFGYAGEFKDHSYRAELEGIYSSVKVDNIGLANSQITLSYLKKAKSAADSSGTDKEYAYGIAVNHDQIENASVMVNAYHHWKNDRFSFSPYVGAGVGVTRMKMFEKSSIRPAYQLKAGLDYHMTEDTKIHVGYRHFGAVGGNFTLETNALSEAVAGGSGKTSAALTQANKPVPAAEKDSINIGNQLFATHGLEVGLTVHFASRA